jgi:hypothetical protein
MQGYEHYGDRVVVFPRYNVWSVIGCGGTGRRGLVIYFDRNAGQRELSSYFPIGFGN